MVMERYITPTAVSDHTARTVEKPTDLVRLESFEHAFHKNML